MKWPSRYQRLRKPCQVKEQRNDVFAVTLSKALLITDYFHSFPSSKNPHFQNEAKCTTCLVKMSFICMRLKNHFLMKG